MATELPSWMNEIELTREVTEEEQAAVDAWATLVDEIRRSPAPGDHGLIRIRITAGHTYPRGLSPDIGRKLLQVLREDWERPYESRPRKS